MLKNTFIILAIALVSLSLSSCRTGGGDDLEVKTFRINGSTAELEDGRVVIDSNINDGEFELVWKVDDDGARAYYTWFYLSSNDNLSRGKDIEFYYVYCSSSGRCDNDDENDEDCWFDNNLDLVCEDEDDPDTEIDELIDELPEDLYVIIEACNDFDCDTETVPVRLR
ncbi:MAG: hypothetical protein ABW076_15660 [Candidatus Thiodiazotropha sp.]